MAASGTEPCDGASQRAGALDRKTILLSLEGRRHG